MKITINTFGTRGDVQPYLALGVELDARGHQVTVLTHQIFEDFISRWGLGVKTLPLNPRQILLQQSITEVGGSPRRITRYLVENFQGVMDELFLGTLDAAQGADLIINSGFSLAGWHVAEKLGLPAVGAYLWPATISREMPAVSVKPLPDWIPLKGFYNRASSKLFNQTFFHLMRPLANRCRQDILDLPPLSFRDFWPLDNPHTPTPMLYGFSPAVIPKPADWTDWQQITGYWFLPSLQPYHPPSELVDFLAVGPPPVSIGFGSMVDHERDAATRMVLDALDLCSQRGILLGGWSELGSGALPDNVLRLDAVPHDWLFPRMAAVVHHGGAGTTAAGLRAGMPTVVIPNFADQFFWGRRVQELGAGPKPIPRQKLTASALAEAIHLCLEDPEIHKNAARLGKSIRTENGLENAVDLIERYAKTGEFL